jgi:hypothetical protein
MLVIKLMGGMGNQMFQYAIGKSLSIKYNLPFVLDLSFLKRRDLGSNFTYREFDLDHFNIDENSFVQNIQTEDFVKIVECKFEYNEGVEQTISNSNNKNFYLDGHWQSPKYFGDFEKEIKQDFSLKKSIDEKTENRITDLLIDIKHNESVMVNVRRTDYLNNNFHGVMLEDYFTKAKEIIESKINKPKYFIFSDDIEWCKNNIKFDNMFIVDHTYKGNKFEIYLELMKSCKHFIIPNSTFAWWAAWLSDNKNKIVVCPQKWFTESKINTNDLIPSNWIRI